MNSASGLVVDASVAVKWHLRDETLVDEAGSLLRGFLERRFRLAAPSLIRYEVANSLEQARRRDRITAADAASELQSFLQFGVHDDHDSDALIERAARVARRIGTSVYDAVYLALAEELGLRFVSNDHDLLTKASDLPIAAVHLSEAGAFQ